MKREFNWRDYDDYSKWLQDILETLTDNNKEKDKEIERLKKELDYISSELNKCQEKILDKDNIINELEKWCDIQFQVYKDLDKLEDSRISCQYLRMKDKLKELKEGKEDDK